MLVFGMGAVVARNDPNVEIPMEVNLGVVVTPADGWYSAAEDWDVGETGIALQKSGVYVAFWVDEYRGYERRAHGSALDELKPGFDSFRALALLPGDAWQAISRGLWCTSPGSPNGGRKRTSWWF